MMHFVPALSDVALAIHQFSLRIQLYKVSAAVLLSVLTAYLVTAGLWPVAVGLLLAFPGFVLLNKYPLFGLLVWLVAVQFLMNTESSALRMVYWVLHRMLPPITVIVIVLCSWLKIDDRKLARLSWPELAMLGYLVVTQFSIAYLASNLMGTTYWLYDRVFVPMCLYLIVRLLSPTEADVQRIVPAALFVVGVQAFIGNLSWIVPSAVPSMWMGMHAGSRTTGTLINPVIYTSTLSFCSLLVLHAGLTRARGLVRTLYIATFLVAQYCIFISFTRSSWLGGLVGIAGVTYLHPKFMVRMVLVCMLIAGVAGGIFSQQLSQASERMNSEESEESALSRLPIYYASIQMFRAKPLFGWGYSNFDRYDRDFQARVADLVNPAKDHASHNLYLTILAEQGLSGFLLYMTPFFWWLFHTVRLWSRMPRDGFWSRKLVIVLWLVAAHFVIVNNFFNMIIVYSLGIWWITLGMIGALLTRFERESQADDRNPFALTARRYAAHHALLGQP